MPRIESYTQFTDGWPRFHPYDVVFKFRRRGSKAPAKKAAKVSPKSTVDELFGSQEWRVLQEQVNLEKVELAAHRLARLSLEDFDDVEMTDVSDCSSPRDWSPASESEDYHMQIDDNWYDCRLSELGYEDSLSADMEDVIMGDTAAEWQAEMNDADYELCTRHDSAVDLALREKMIAEFLQQSVTTHRVAENAVGYGPCDEGLEDYHTAIDHSRYQATEPIQRSYLHPREYYEDGQVVEQETGQHTRPATGSQTADHPEDVEAPYSVDESYTYPLTEEEIEELDDRDYHFYMKYGYLD